MDSFASDRKLSELGELDLQDLLDQSDLFSEDEEQRHVTTRRRPSDDTADTGDCVSTSRPSTSNTCMHRALSVYGFFHTSAVISQLTEEMKCVGKITASQAFGIIVAHLRVVVVCYFAQPPADLVCGQE